MKEEAPKRRQKDATLLKDIPRQYLKIERHVAWKFREDAHVPTVSHGPAALEHWVHA